PRNSAGHSSRTGPGLWWARQHGRGPHRYDRCMTSADPFGFIGLTYDDVLLLPGERSEEHTSELQSRFDLVCRLLLEKKNILIHVTYAGAHQHDKLAEHSLR